MKTTPASLLERIRDPRDTASWERFVAYCSPFIYYWARRMNLPDQEATDFVQEIFLLLLQKMPEFVYNPDGRFRGWLFTVIRNQYRKRLKKEQALEALPDLSQTGEQEAFEEEEFRKHLIKQAMKLMETDFAPTTWQAFWEMTVEGKSAKEVAQKLGLSEQAVFQHRSRVLRRLKEELAGLMD